MAPAVADLFGPGLPFAVRAYDGSRAAGPADGATTLVVRSPRALRRILTAPGELGLARAYVAGDLDVDGDIYAIADFVACREDLGVGIAAAAHLLRVAGVGALRPLAPPAEEVHLRGRLHSKRRDDVAVRSHYDVSNAFYRLVLGPSMTYSCAVFAQPDDTLERAQENKYELICRKLALAPGMRLLDVGCGWGGMLLHAARHHGVRAVGVTLSRVQANLARCRVADAGLSNLVEVRVQDYRDVGDGPYDAISSIGMVEHVGRTMLPTYFDRLHALLRDGGRLLNHGITRPWRPDEPRQRGSAFIEHYVFPDGELHEVGTVCSVAAQSGFEVAHVEDLRDHYARTLRCWVHNLEENWHQAVAEVGAARARIWHLYMAACAIGFEIGRTQIHQVLAVRPDGRGTGMPLRPDWDGRE